MLQLTFNPGLTLTDFRTTRSWCMNAREAGPCFDIDSLRFSFKGQMNQHLDIFSSDILKQRNVKQNV